MSVFFFYAETSWPSDEPASVLLTFLSFQAFYIVFLFFYFIPKPFLHFFAFLFSLFHFPFHFLFLSYYVYLVTFNVSLIILYTPAFFYVLNLFLFSPHICYFLLLFPFWLFCSDLSSHSHSLLRSYQFLSIFLYFPSFRHFILQYYFSV